MSPEARAVWRKMLATPEGRAAIKRISRERRQRERRDAPPNGDMVKMMQAPPKGKGTGL